MAGPYYVDDGGDGTTESSWATADISINDLDAEYAFASGEIVYFGHNHVCQATNTASLIITGPSSGAPTLFISATQGSSPPTYQQSATNQIDTSEASTYDLTFDGSFALYGMKVKSGRKIVPGNDHDETFDAYDTTFAVGTASYLSTGAGVVRLTDCVIDLTQDGTTPISVGTIVPTGGSLVIDGLTFVNAGYRTGAIITLATSAPNQARISGCDFSGFTGTACELIDTSASSTTDLFMNNCITVANPTFFTSSRPRNTGFMMLVNVGPSHSPVQMAYRDYWGDVISSATISRTGGASIESLSSSWLVTTSTPACEASPLKTPWIYGEVASTGSKTFDLYITNDTADFTDAEVWLEVESLSTSEEAVFGVANDARATILTTAAAQDDDTSSSWSGTGPSYTYKQKLSVTTTVAVAGQFRARVCVGVASISSGRYFYIDPKVTVS